VEPEGIFRRRRLPHWGVEGKPIFITACLDGSISAAGLSRIQHYREELDGRTKPPQPSEHEWERKKDKLVFRLVDELPDHQSPVRHLEDERQAKIVQDAFLHFADERYSLFAFVVMPSHHHWLFLPNERWSQAAVEQAIEERAKRKTPREIISHSVQSYTGTMCNRIRGESGSYWQGETFDHWARDEDETYRIIHYIENNPVKAGLADRPEQWQWSSARIRANSGLQLGDAIRKSHVG
jgi:putative transposase